MNLPLFPAALRAAALPAGAAIAFVTAAAAVPDAPDSAAPALPAGWRVSSVQDASGNPAPGEMEGESAARRVRFSAPYAPKPAGGAVPAGWRLAPADFTLEAAPVTLKNGAGEHRFSMRPYLLVPEEKDGTATVFDPVAVSVPEAPATAAAILLEAEDSLKAAAERLETVLGELRTVK